MNSKPNTVPNSIGLKPIKIDEIYTASAIHSDIFARIQEAAIILADVTGKNPNVNYELGIAHALSKRAVIITQSIEDVPFDYRHIRCIVYDTKVAGWEKKLKAEIELAVRATIEINAATTVLAGDNLQNLLLYLTDTALDTSYEFTRHSRIESDEYGNCLIIQRWKIKAITDITHFIHGKVIDQPGAIKLIQVQDLTNRVELRSIVSVAEPTMLRNIIFFKKLLKAGEQLVLEMKYTADNYISDLFTRGREMIFQRIHTKRGASFRKIQDTYLFPFSEDAKNISVIFNKSARKEKFNKKIVDDKVAIDVTLDWTEPYSGNYSYELVQNIDG